MLVTSVTKIPKSWQAFLRVDENKTDLFHFLADLVSNATDICEHVLVTHGKHVHSNSQINKQSIDPCSHALILRC